MPPDIVPISSSPRSIRTHAKVISSTQELLAGEPFAAVTTERIAAHSGVSTATLYKHWPSKTAIIAEAFGRTADAEVPVANSDDPRSDLIEFAVRSMTFHSSPGQRVLVELLAACAVEPHGAAYLQEYYLGPRRSLIRPVWRRAVEAGAVRSDIDVELALDVLFGAALFRLLRGADDGELRLTLEVSMQGLLA